jgi:hypothetical protein
MDGNIAPVWDQYTRAIYNHYWDVMHAGMQAHLDKGEGRTLPAALMANTYGGKKLALDPREELIRVSEAQTLKEATSANVLEIKTAIADMTKLITPTLEARLQNFAKQVQYGKFGEKRPATPSQETTDMFEKRAVSLDSTKSPTAKWAGILEFGNKQEDSPFAKYIEASPEAAQTVGARGVAARIPDSDLEDMSGRDTAYVDSAFAQAEPTRSASNPNGVTIRNVDNLEQAKADVLAGEGVWTMSPATGVPSVNAGKHFGNPWDTGSTKGAVTNYRDWLNGKAHQTTEPNRREWILSQIPKLAGRNLIYYKDSDLIESTSHADVLKGMVQGYEFEQESPNFIMADHVARLNTMFDNNSSGEGRILYSRAWVDTVRAQVAPSEDGAYRKIRRNTLGKARTAGGKAMRAFESFSQMKGVLKQEDQRNAKAVEDYLKKHNDLRGRVDSYLGTFNMSLTKTESARVDDIYWGIDTVMVDEVQADGTIKQSPGSTDKLAFAQDIVIRDKVAQFQAEREKAIHEVRTAHPGLAKVLDRMRNNLERMSDIGEDDVFSYDRMSFSISPGGVLMSSRPSYRMKGPSAKRLGDGSVDVIYQSMGRLATAVAQDKVDSYLDNNAGIEQFKDALFTLHMAPEIATLLRDPESAGWSLSEKRDGIRIAREESLNRGTREQLYENFKANVKNKEDSTMFSGIGDSLDTAHLPEEIRDVISGDQGGGSFFSYVTSQAGERAAKAALASSLVSEGLVIPAAKPGFRRIPSELGIEGFATPDTIAALHEALDFGTQGFFAKVFNKLIGLSHTMLTAGNFVAGPLRQGLGGLVITAAAGGTDPRIVGRAYARAWHYFYTEALGIPKPEGAMTGPLAEFYGTDTVWNDTLRGVNLRDAEVSMAARNAQVARVVDQKTAEAAYQSAMRGDMKPLEAIMAKLSRVEDIGLAWFQLSDNAWKDAAFEAALAGELKDPSLRDAGGKISPDTLIKMENRASEWVKSRYPTMERVTGITNILKKAKLAPFVSFLDQAYMLTVMNPINDIKTLNEKGLLMEGLNGEGASAHQKKMYKARAIRGLIGSTAVMVGIPMMAMMISKAFGVDDEEEEEYRAMLAPFERDSMSLAMFKGPDGVIRHVNLDFMNFMSAPLSSFRSAQMAYGRTKKVGSLEEAATDAFFAWLNTITEPARTFNVGIGATIEAVGNRKESGGEIVNPEATRSEHISKRTWHAASSFLVPNSLRKVMPGKGFWSGTDSYGNPVNPLEVITQIALPLRAEVDYEKAGTAKIYEAKRAMENADRYFRSTISRMPTEEGTKMSKAQADKVFLRESAQLSLVMNGLRRRGKSEDEISSLLGTSGIKSYAVDAISNGMASGYRVSQSTLDKAFAKSGVDVTPWVPEPTDDVELE